MVYAFFGLAFHAQSGQTIRLHSFTFPISSGQPASSLTPLVCEARVAARSAAEAAERAGKEKHLLEQTLQVKLRRPKGGDLGEVPRGAG